MKPNFLGLIVMDILNLDKSSDSRTRDIVFRSAIGMWLMSCVGSFFGFGTIINVAILRVFGKHYLNASIKNVC